MLKLFFCLHKSMGPEVLVGMYPLFLVDELVLNRH